jgi:hypothetical protein
VSLRSSSFATASVTPDGKPKTSSKGSITVLSDGELGLADLASARKYSQNPPLSQGRRQQSEHKTPRTRPVNPSPHVTGEERHGYLCHRSTTLRT